MNPPTTAGLEGCPKSRNRGVMFALRHTPRNPWLLARESPENSKLLVDSKTTSNSTPEAVVQGVRRHSAR
eukprot:13861577-Alexandrium_andersonii.AAC.1